MPEHGEEDFSHAKSRVRKRYAIGIAEIAGRDEATIERAGGGNVAFDDRHHELPMCYHSATPHQRYLLPAFPFRCALGITNFSPDQTSSTAQTLMSTRPSGSAVSRTTTSLRSVATPLAFLGHDTQIMPSGAIVLRRALSLPASPSASVTNTCTMSSDAAACVTIFAPSGSLPTISP